MYLTICPIVQLLCVGNEYIEHASKTLKADSCRAIVRNGNSISTDSTEDTIENDSMDACFIYLDSLRLGSDF